MMELFCLSAGINGVAMIIAGLENQLDNNKTEILNPESMRNALNGVQTHLERIAKDLEELERGKRGQANEISIFIFVHSLVVKP